jgi:hypothetical protein
MEIEMTRTRLIAALVLVAALNTAVQASPFIGLATGDVDFDSDRDTKRFSAAFVIHEDGTARGNVTLSDGRIRTTIRFLEAVVDVDCDTGEIDIIFLATIRQTAPGGPPTQDLMVGSVSTTDSPDCIIWDIQDGCPSIEPFDVPGVIFEIGDSCIGR